MGSGHRSHLRLLGGSVHAADVISDKRAALLGAFLTDSSTDRALPMPKSKTVRVVAGIAASFVGLVGTIIFLFGMGIIGSVMAKLMLVALLGVYVGLGVLIAIYRLIGKLE